MLSVSEEIVRAGSLHVVESRRQGQQRVAGAEHTVFERRGDHADTIQLMVVGPEGAEILPDGPVLLKTPILEVPRPQYFARVHGFRAPRW